MSSICGKKDIKVWKIFKNQGKRFDIVMSYMGVVILGGMGTIS